MNACPSQKETVLGIFYVLFQYTVLPSLLFSCNRLPAVPLSEAKLNLVFFAVNCLSCLLIFRRFLKASFVPVREHPGTCLQTLFLGFFLCVIAQGFTAACITALLPDFLNLNDQALGTLAGSDFLITALGTVILVPPAEECIHRGMIFRGLYARSPALAYGVSSAVFSLIHILGFLGVYDGPALAAAFCQYLLPGLILAWSFRRSGTIYVSILIHALINLKGMVLFLVR